MEPKKKAGYGFDWYFPPLGQRIVKTTVAVLICLVIYALRGYRGIEMPTEAAITAIICMQPYASDTAIFARDRFTGTLIGAFWGLLFLLLLLLFPGLGKAAILYPLMALGVLVSLYSAVVMRRMDASSLAAIVFICVVIAYPEIEEPLQQAFHRIIDVMVGTTVAICVNIFRFPREKRRDQVFFMRTRDLVPDQLAQISSNVLFRLNYLVNDGARVCLISEHAPAFFLSQMSAVRLNTPLIVMDGAAIYDAQENTYLWTENLKEDSSRWLMERLEKMNVSFFIYTVRNHRTCIFHQGNVTRGEKIVYERMRRSPYRHYLDGDSFDLREIVYVKVIAPHMDAEAVIRALEKELPQQNLRWAVRRQPGLSGSVGLYFYAEGAYMEHAEKELMAMLQKDQPTLEPIEVFSNTGYRTEHDAVHLMHVLSKKYEPLKWTVLWENRKQQRKRRGEKE